MRIKTIWAIVTVMALALAFAIFVPQPTKTTGELEKKYDVRVVDSIVYDTLPYYQPVPRDSVILRYETVKLPVAQPIDTTTEKPVETISEAVDSIEVEIPITQKEYQDSTYHAWVSGYHPSLDSIQIFQKTVYSTTILKPKQKRWGLGVQAGYGFGKEGMTPYVGVGVHYNIFSW